MQQAATFKVPEPGIVPRLGDILNSRHVYELQVGHGYTVKAHANDPEQARDVAISAGYTPLAIRPISEDAA